MRARWGLIGLVAVSVLAAPSSAVAVAPVPAWSIQSLAAPTNFKPGDESGKAGYQVFLTNSGGATTDHSGEITIVDTLPAGLVVKGVKMFAARRGATDIGKEPACESKTVGEVSTVTCRVTDSLLPAAEPAKLYPGD